MHHEDDRSAEPAPKPPHEPPSFGAGAFEATDPATPREVELEPTRPLESSEPPSVIELGPSTPVVDEHASETVALESTASEPMHASEPFETASSSTPLASESTSASVLPPPPAITSTTFEPPPPPRVVAHEVEAVPFGRFDAPAPTIDVEARRPSPPPPAEPPRAPSFEPAPVPPIASATTTPSSDATAEAARASTSSSSSTTSSGATTSSGPRASDGTSRWWSAFCHLFLFLDFVTLFLGSVLTVLVWQLAGKNDPLLDDQGREALNFQLNVAILSALLLVSCVGSLLVVPVCVIAAVFCVVGAIRAANGERFRYPLIVRLVRA